MVDRAPNNSLELYVSLTLHQNKRFMLCVMGWDGPHGKCLGYGTRISTNVRLHLIFKANQMRS